jgi:two-component system response regulator (stage 0 sporulation protein A)
MEHHAESLLDHIRFLARRFSLCDSECVLVLLLIEVGIPAKLAGYHFLKTAISLYNEDAIRMINKGLYASVAKQHGKNISQVLVEGAIRDAIRAGWENRAGKMWDHYFPGVKGINLKPPSNHEFISEVARILNLWAGVRRSIERDLAEKEECYGTR